MDGDLVHGPGRRHHAGLSIHPFRLVDPDHSLGRSRICGTTFTAGGTNSPMPEHAPAGRAPSLTWPPTPATPTACTEMCNWTVPLTLQPRAGQVHPGVNGSDGMTGINQAVPAGRLRSLFGQ